MAGYATSPDLVLTGTIGEYVAGEATFDSGDAISIVCMASNYVYTPNVAVIPTTALCDRNAKNQPGLGSGTVTVDLMVPIGGSPFYGSEGKPIRFSTKTDATVATAKVLDGLITGAVHSAPNSGLQTIALSVTLGIPVAA